MPLVQPPPRSRSTRDLTEAQRRLVLIMRENQFGHIENLPVVAGQPHLDEGVRVVRVSLLGGSSEGPKVTRADDFELKQSVCNLFDEMERIKDGLIIRLTFRHGLPWQLESTSSCRFE